MNVCAANDFQKADVELNAAYGELMGRVSEKGRVLLRDAQRAWIAYRNRQCAFNTARTAGGSINPMVRSQCFAELTKTQTAVLRQQIDCVEGDVACGNQ
jgi:uncharacterized protein YecT (DUF1311 family)